MFLSESDVRKVARLARLALTDEQVEHYRTRLSAVLGYVEQLGALDLSGVEPMSHPGRATNRLDEDEPGNAIPTDRFMSIAPEGAAESPYLRVPKVLGDGGGA